MTHAELEDVMREVYCKLAAELLDALKGVALSRELLRETGYVLDCEYAANEWARLPETIAEAVSCLVHCTYNEDLVARQEWQPWRGEVREELARLLAQCGPIRLIK